MKYPKLKLLLDVATRWNSTYYMLERFYPNQEPIISTLALLRLEYELSEAEWLIMNEASDTRCMDIRR